MLVKGLGMIALLIAVTSGGVILANKHIDNSTPEEVYVPYGNFSFSSRIVDINITIHNGNDVHLYWEVHNGVGCCNTFNCDYQLFNATCLRPDFKLYSITLDDEFFNFSEQQNWTEWEYTCSAGRPWNWFNYYGLSPGHHNITIYQKECTDDIMDIYYIEVVI